MSWFLKGNIAFLTSITSHLSYTFLIFKFSLLFHFFLMMRGQERIYDEYLKNKYKKQKCEKEGELKAELDKYLDEDTEEDFENFDILSLWKFNSLRFSTMEKIARDVLAIPISTVASESVFSTSGRVLDPFRSSLTPKVVESLICAQDWLHSSSIPNIEEALEDLEQLEGGNLFTNYIIL